MYSVDIHWSHIWEYEAMRFVFCVVCLTSIYVFMLKCERAWHTPSPLRCSTCSSLPTYLPKEGPWLVDKWRSLAACYACLPWEERKQIGVRRRKHFHGWQLQWHSGANFPTWTWWHSKLLLVPHGWSWQNSTPQCHQMMSWNFRTPLFFWEL